MPHDDRSLRSDLTRRRVRCCLGWIASILAGSAPLSSGGAMAQDDRGFVPASRAFDFSDLNRIEITIPTSEAEKHLEEAKRLEKSGRWQAAVVEASIGIGLATDFVEGYRFREKIYGSHKLYRQAIADLSRVLQISAGDWMSLLRRGYYACMDRDFEGGFADFELALSLTKTTVERAAALNWRGKGWSLRGDDSRAIADYRSSIELGGENFGILLDRGCSFAKILRHDLAIADFDRSIALNPSAMGSFYRAESRMARGEWALAQADYERAIEANFREAWCHLGRGWARLAQGQVDGAIEDFERSLEIAPGFDRAFTARGWAFLSKRELDRANRDFEAALQTRQPCQIRCDLGFSKSIALHPEYDRAVDEFYRRSREFPNLRWALIFLRGDDARSHSLEYPYLAAYLVCRSRPDAAIAPNLIGQLVVDWRCCPEHLPVAIGQAIIAARRSQWTKSYEDLAWAWKTCLESSAPALFRPTLPDFLGLE